MKVLETLNSQVPLYGYLSNINTLNGSTLM